ncbi:winged helix-turn-helix domain-containing protein [Streptomyces sp. NPDC048643]|uniref:ArsR/SmtB family transcription factor n=1 Tax=Streptomyces sp. NPDC048643 TaxID=3155637 RepID=UPI003435B339
MQRGTVAVLNGLHPSLSFTDSLRQHPQEVQTNGPTQYVTGSVLLLPNGFQGSPPRTRQRHENLTVFYGARQAGELPSFGRRESPPVSSPRRAILRSLDMARTTTELARLHQLSPSTVSYHLAKLYEAGRVSRNREGARVYYMARPSIASS